MVRERCSLSTLLSYCGVRVFDLRVMRISYDRIRSALGQSCWTLGIGEPAQAALGTASVIKRLRINQFRTSSRSRTLVKDLLNASRLMR